MCCIVYFSVLVGLLTAYGQTCVPGDVRLVDGAVVTEGRVEICSEGTWGTVCDDLWDFSDGKVVCRQLGFPTTTITVYTGAHFGQGSGSIILDNVDCSGTESTLLSCLHGEVGIHNCQHSEDAGVICGGVCTHGDLRLKDGRSSNQGRLELCISGSWGTVCDDTWNDNNAEVACRQLGYNSIGARGRSNSFFGESNKLVLLDHVHCSGSETALISCMHSGLGNAVCGNSDEAGVICPAPCIHGDVRLVDGYVSSDGRVEICINGVWGTVCDDYWGVSDAIVVCRQVGNYSSGKALSNAYFGQGTGRIWLDNLGCSGSESKLLDCTNSGIGTNDCTHSEDASVSCILEGDVSKTSAVSIGVGISVALLLSVCLPLIVCFAVFCCVANKKRTRQPTVTTVTGTTAVPYPTQTNNYPTTNYTSAGVQPPSYTAHPNSGSAECPLFYPPPNPVYPYPGQQLPGGPYPPPQQPHSSQETQPQGCPPPYLQADGMQPTTPPSYEENVGAKYN